MNESFSMLKNRHQNSFRTSATFCSEHPPLCVSDIRIFHSEHLHDFHSEHPSLFAPLIRQFLFRTSANFCSEHLDDFRFGHPTNKFILYKPIPTIRSLDRMSGRTRMKRDKAVIYDQITIVRRNNQKNKMFPLF